MMPGVTFEEITNQLVDAYDYGELTKVLRNRMNTRLDVITAPAPFDRVVFELLSWAERNGREVELVQVAARAKPGHAGMQQIYKKYGMSIPVWVQAAGVSVPAAPTDVTDAGFEQVVRPHLEAVDFAIWRERMTRVEGQVCRVLLNGRATGTGFLVGPQAVLTNYHVLENVIAGRPGPEAVTCEFDYKLLKDNSRTGTPVGLHADWLIDYSGYPQGEADGEPDRDLPTTDQLDYALVRLAEPVGEGPAVPHPRPEEKEKLKRGWVRVPDVARVEDVARPFKSPMAVLIAQHPDGRPLKLAADTDAINQAAGLWLNANQTRIRYATNTDNGSSGSPCFDFEWNLIALHHYGDPAYNHKPQWNQGVPIGMIRTRLQRQPELAAALGGDSP